MIGSSTHLINEISSLLVDSKHMVIFTGAGISTASGVPDYRGPDGVWTRRDQGLQPRAMKTPWNEVLPNKAHNSIVDLQELGIMKALISQNVDGLHLKSGINPNIIAELHGNKDFMKCLFCDQRYTKMEILWDDSIYGKGYRSSEPTPNQPSCPNCENRIISSIINFSDPMPEKETIFSHEQSKLSDLFLVIGSSLVVHPAAGYPRIAKKHGAKLIIINQGKTPMDNIADIAIDEDCTHILPRIVDEVKIKLKNR
ncbi:MAG: NAD-dependent protein deacylase 2 [Candidatus Heimdallarchaeota archaeon LC_2]|nr:MAG: NAD-dependent protein deacylase 2 [Candidatus Heimdallarchaeota archaeon LC_2]